jgi:hypothetical protein
MKQLTIAAPVVALLLIDEFQRNCCHRAQPKQLARSDLASVTRNTIETNA